MPRFDTDLSDEGVKRPTIDPKLYRVEISGCKPTTAKAQFGEASGNSGESTLFVWEVTVIEPGVAYGHKLQYLSNTNDKAVREDGTIDPSTGQKRLVPDPDAHKTSNYYLRENFLKPLHAPFEKSGFSTDDVIHCKAKAKVTLVPGKKDPSRMYNQIEAFFPDDESPLA